MAARRRDVLAAFKKAKAVFFYKTMTTTMVADGPGSKIMRLELPFQFAMKHGEEMNQVVALVRPASCGGGEWSLLFEGYHHHNNQSRVYVFGGGWRDFVLDSGISIGEFLVFELVDRSRLIVHVYPRDDQFGIHPRGLCRSVEEESGLLHPPRSGNADQKDMGQSRPSRPSSTPVNVAWDHIGFKKTMRASHGSDCKSVKLDIPTPFWRSHGCDKFDGVSYTLEGPRMKGDVKTAVIRTNIQTKCIFSAGWKEFFIANKLKIGDTLVFTLSGRYQFDVSVEA